MPKARKHLLSEFAKGNHDSLVRRLSRRLRHQHDAEDAAQDTYVRLLRSSGTEPIANFSAFLSKSAHNLSIDKIRARNRRAHVEAQLAPEMQDLAVAPPSSDPERTLEARQHLEAIADAINELPTRCRTAFLLHRFHGLSYTDIAKELNVSKSSVEKYIISALEACRKRVL